MLIIAHHPVLHVKSLTTAVSDPQHTLKEIQGEDQLEALRALGKQTELALR